MAAVIRVYPVGGDEEGRTRMQVGHSNEQLQLAPNETSEGKAPSCLQSPFILSEKRRLQLGT